jgi:hypothetical protein
VIEYPEADEESALEYIQALQSLVFRLEEKQRR